MCVLYTHREHTSQPANSYPDIVIAPAMVPLYWVQTKTTFPACEYQQLAGQVPMAGRYDPNGKVQVNFRYTTMIIMSY